MELLVRTWLQKVVYDHKSQELVLVIFCLVLGQFLQKNIRRLNKDMFTCNHLIILLITIVNVTLKKNIYNTEKVNKKENRGHRHFYPISWTMAIPVHSDEKHPVKLAFPVPVG